MTLAMLVVAVLNLAIMTVATWVGLHVALGLHRVGFVQALIVTCCVVLVRHPLIRLADREQDS